MVLWGVVTCLCVVPPPSTEIESTDGIESCDMLMVCSVNNDLVATNNQRTVFEPEEPIVKVKADASELKGRSRKAEVPQEK